jgi:biopolymer transport protein ExbB
MDNPSVLAGDIGEAMVTTAAGLLIAVPALFAYHWFTSRTSQFASFLGEEVSNLMHGWFLKKEGAR